MIHDVYVVQPFSRDAAGALVWDAPVWSRDRSFALALTAALKSRKAGVLTFATILDPAGDLSAEAEILGSHGAVPSTVLSPCRAPTNGLGEIHPAPALAEPARHRARA